MKLWDKAKGLYSEAREFHLGKASSIFKIFIAVVLMQFAALSLVSVGTGNAVKDIPVVESVIASSHFWWGFLGLFGACSLIFEKYIKESLVTVIIGYASAILSLALLSYDFLATKPPIFTGGILAATAVVFLGGLLYGRIKHR